MSTLQVVKVCEDTHMENNIQERRAQRLDEWMRLKGLSQADVTRRTGLSRAYISLLLKKDKPFGEKAARAMEQSLFMPRGYLDEDGELSLKPVLVWERPEDLEGEGCVLVPRVSVQLSAGGGSVVQGEEEMPPLAFRADWLKKKNITSKSNLRTCTVSGDSMEPYLSDGDTVLIDMGQTKIIDNEVYAIEAYDEVRIKRLSRRIDGGLLVRSDNPRFPEESLTPEQAQHLRPLGRCVWRAG